ncbi:cytidine deaminase [Micromonospora sp. NPDC049523]|uniref:cytidine deaminase n=1 Tax=Micromonospora sp. NPDC049523 TaxID=3155921 RepID=UPI00343A9526
MPESYAVSAAAPAGPIGSAAAPAELSAEDAKLVVLARGARARIGAVEGAAVRDQDGRTYAAASVSLPSLTITALQLAVASAAAAGASRLEAAAVVTEASTLDGAGHAAVRDLAAEAPIHVAAPDGTLLGTVLA